MISSPSSLFAKDLLPDPNELDVPTDASVNPGPFLQEPPSPRPLVRFDAGRPWPLGLPDHRQVLEVIGGQAALDEGIRELHLRIAATLPESIYDAVRASLGDVDHPVARATVSAWRAIVAADRVEAALGIDVAAVVALVSEAAEGREVLVASSCFALDGGRGLEELLALLGRAIEVLASRAAFKARARRRGAAALAGVMAVGTFVAHDAKERRLLPKAFAVTMAVTLLFYGYQALTVAPSAEWVVVGDVDRGHAFLAPAKGGADQASLERMRASLEAQGYTTTKAASGEWVVRRRPKRTP